MQSSIKTANGANPRAVTTSYFSLNFTLRARISALSFTIFIFCENYFKILYFFKKLVPENTSLYKHNLEGPDDMPAHIKSMLTQTSLIIPISNKKMNLGTWQGIFLIEHRTSSMKRKINLTLMGELEK